MIRIISILLVFVSHEILAQQLFHKSLVGDNTNGYCISDANPDGGYTIAGRMTFSGMVVVSFDACDNVKWEKSFDALNGNVDLVRIAVASNGDILLAGKYRNLNNDFFLIKLSAQGDLLFFKRYGQQLTDDLFDFGILYGEGYYISGVSNQNGTTVPLLMRLDINGDIQWSKSYADFSNGLRAVATKDGGLIIQMKNIVKVDAQGNVEWTKEYEFNSGNAYHHIMNPIELEDGYVFVYYYTANQSAQRSGSFKLDLNGNLLWVGKKFEGGTMGDIALLDNKHIMVLSMRYSDPNGQPIYLTKLDATGNVVRVINKKIPRDNYQGYAFNLNRLFGGDLIITGYEKELLDIPTVRQLYVTRTNYEFDLDDCGEDMDVIEGVRDTIEFSDGIAQDEFQPMLVNDVTPVFGSFSFNEEYLCKKEIELQVDIGNDTSICVGEEFTLTSSHNFLTYLWSNGSTAKSIRVNQPGVYILTASNGCVAISDTIVVRNFTALKTDYSIVPQKSSAIEPIYFSSSPDSGMQVSWTFVEGESEEAFFDHTFNSNGIFPISFTITDGNGCNYSDTSYVEIAYSSIYFPNSFTPNGDGKNDLFQPEGFGIKHYQLNIFNRWGDVIFTSTNEPWNGHNSDADSFVGTFMYKAQVEDDFGQIKEYTGVVRVLK